MSASHYNGGYFKLYVQDFVLFAPKNLFSVYRVTVVFGTPIIRSGRGPCHNEHVNDSQSLCPYWYHQSILEISTGKIFHRFVCLCLSFLLYASLTFVLGCVTGGCDENIFNVHVEFHLFNFENFMFLTP